MRTILVVDDEAAARYGVRRALESKYKIMEAGSAGAARELGGCGEAGFDSVGFGDAGGGWDFVFALGCARRGGRRR